MRILVIEDDGVIQGAVVRTLRAEGYAVTPAADLATAREAAAAGVDLVVLDLRLPDGFGLDFCRELRQSGSAVSVLVVSALTRVAMRVESLDAGADDFLPKPFAIAELRARVRALGRRGHGPRGQVIVIGEAVLDFPGRYATRDGESVPLTAREWHILEFLARRSGRVVQHADLLEGVWGEVNDALADTLTVLVGRLRRKLGVHVIKTVWGEGYALGDGRKREP
ncbi:MAG TPA: response regulator transcription factor [Polyangiaceae bacterium]|nr:response regulator transcription factor [Polyangiaceae bacterium]